tara:strand:+ start:396 stop:692 length:297 start_codon:yes stop_codon:yes gene_type:complete
MVEPQNPNPQQTQANPNDLTIQDLAILKNIIEMSTERGVFKAPELATVGSVFNKLEAFLKNVEEQAKAAQEGQAAAQQPPVDPAPQAEQIDPATEQKE